MKRCAGSLSILLSASLFTACASTSMRSVYRQPDFRSDAIRQVLVIGHFEDQALRKIFEQEFVRQWSARGVKAVSSLEVLPASVSLNKVDVAPLAKAQGYDTVLVSRLLKKQKIAAGEPARPSLNPDSGNDLQNINTILQVMLAPPVYATDYDLVTVETNLYDVVSEKRVWSATSETEVMGNIPKLIPPFVKVVLKDLYTTP